MTETLYDDFLYALNEDEGNNKNDQYSEENPFLQ